MDGIIRKDIEDYAEAHSSPESDLFRQLVKVTHEKCEWPEMQVGHLEGSFLRLITKISGARRIIEIGTYTGYSTLSFAEGLPDDGEVIACDIDPENTKVAQEYWKKSPHGKKIKLIIGPAGETLDSLTGTFDLAFIDADKTGTREYYEKILSKMPSGGLILVDNALMDGHVLKPDGKSDSAMAEFNDFVKTDSRVESLLLTIRDGIMLCRKK